MSGWHITVLIEALVLGFLSTRIQARKQLITAWLFLIMSAVFLTAAEHTTLRWPTTAGWALLAVVCVRACQSIASELLSNRFGRALILSDLTATAGYAGVIVWALIHFGVNISGVFATSAVLTAVVGLSLQDLILNLASGLYLQIEGNYRRGIWIQTDREPGCILELRARHTRVETADGDYLVIPNSLILRSSVRVLAQSRRRQITFTLPYELSPAAVTQAVQKALCASAIPETASSPEPQCFVAQFHPAHVEYGIYVWGTRPGHTTTSSSVVLTRTWYALARLGVGPLAISQSVELKSAEKEASVPANGRPALLSQMELFSMLSGAELELLASRLRELKYAPGECILRQGDEGESMFVIVSGRVEVLLQHESGQQEHVTALGEREFFGEMSLLTGDRRTASVMAIGEVICLEIHKSDLEGILRSRPEVAAEMSQVLSERQSVLANLQETLDSRVRERSASRDLLSRIERFFGFNEAFR